MSHYGTFIGEVITRWESDNREPDRNMTLVNDFRYIDPDDRTWDAPANSAINGASIPAALWSIVGSPYTGDYRRASVVHDVACDSQGISPKDADVMFFYACLCGGCTLKQAGLFYLAVRLGSWARKNLASYQTSCFAAAKLSDSLPVSSETDDAFLQKNLLNMNRLWEEEHPEIMAFDDPISVLDAIFARHIVVE